MDTVAAINAVIFALTGWVVEFSSTLVPAAFILAAVISAFSGYSDIELSNKNPQRTVSTEEQMIETFSLPERGEALAV